MARVIYEHFWLTGTHETILDFSDLMEGTSRGDDVQGFWYETSTHEVLSDNILESLYNMQIRESDLIKTVLAFVRTRNCTEEYATELPEIEDRSEEISGI